MISFLAMMSLFLLSFLPLTSMQLCTSGAFPKVLGSDDDDCDDDCFTEIRQLDIDEVNDRVVVAGLSNIVGLTRKGDNKKSIIVMLKLTKDGSNS